jgi:predicted metal-dependent hydrolase
VSRAGGHRYDMDSVQADGTGVPTRSMEFDEWFSDVPRHFAGGGDVLMSHVFAVLSSVFPGGEAYFVRSVRSVRHRITDPRLREAVEGFIGQESMHGREHRAFNEHLATLGYPTGPIDTYIRGLTWLRERFLSETMNVAIVAALEHYTATLAETVLTDPEARAALGHRAARYLLVWHALEELEHKAVAFDVYRSIEGTERMRVAAMWLVHVNFVLETGIWTLVSLALDPTARRHPGRLVRNVWASRRSPFTSARALRRLSSYHHRAFHPNDCDDSELIAAWRAELFGADGALVGQRRG